VLTVVRETQQISEERTNVYRVWGRIGNLLLGTNEPGSLVADRSRCLEGSGKRSPSVNLSSRASEEGSGTIIF